MAIFSLFSVFTLLVSHVIVINNQVNVVVSSDEADDISRLFEQLAQFQSFVLAQKNNPIFVNKVIISIKETVDSDIDGFVQTWNSADLCGKTSIKKKLTFRLIQSVRQDFPQLNQHYMNQIVNATNR